MTTPVQLLAVAISVVLMLLVLELVRRRALREEYALMWILGAGALIVLSAWRDGIHLLARTLGIHYPPAALILLLTLFMFVGLLYFSVVASTQRRQIEYLLVESALLEERLRQVESKEIAPARTRRDSGEPEERVETEDRVEVRLPI